MLYELYTIGHGNKNLDEFIETLKKFNIQILVDIRSIPYSRAVPQYNKEDLIKNLNKKHIKYLFFGDKLGGKPQKGFSRFVETIEFKRNVGKLLFCVKNRTAALMCSEFDYMNCHRKFISEKLRKNGICIKDIDKNSEIVSEEQFSIKQY